MKLDDAGVRNTGGGERRMRTPYHEIGFVSKPISEFDLKDEAHLNVGVGGGNLCHEG